MYHHVSGNPDRTKMRFKLFKGIIPFTENHGLDRISREYFSHCRVTRMCADYCDKEAVMNVGSQGYDYKVRSYCKKCAEEKIKALEIWLNRGGKPGEPIYHYKPFGGYAHDGGGYRRGGT